MYFVQHTWKLFKECAFFPSITPFFVDLIAELIGYWLGEFDRLLTPRLINGVLKYSFCIYCDWSFIFVWLRFESTWTKLLLFQVSSLLQESLWGWKCQRSTISVLKSVISLIMFRHLATVTSWHLLTLSMYRTNLVRTTQKVQGLALPPANFSHYFLFRNSLHRIVSDLKIATVIFEEVKKSSGYDRQVFYYLLIIIS